MKWLVIVLAAAALGVAATQEKAPATAAAARLWIFFAPDQDLESEFERLGEALRKVPHLAIRPVLLARDVSAAERPSVRWAAILEALFRMGSPAVGLVDPEGLAMAKRLGIGLLPAFAVEEAVGAGVRGSFRVAQGKGIDFEGLLR